LPAILAVGTLLAVPRDSAWAIWALLLGWTSHLVGDFVFGERPEGVPMGPWWGYAGLGFDSGGRLERTLRRGWPLVLAWQVWVFNGGDPWPMTWPVSWPMPPG
jgi:hypothetical protein